MGQRWRTDRRVLAAVTAVAAVGVAVALAVPALAAPVVPAATTGPIVGAAVATSPCPGEVTVPAPASGAVVTVDGAPATVVATGPGIASLAVELPAEPTGTVVTVTVSAATGSAFPSQSYEYQCQNGPPPTVAEVSPGSGPFYGGTQVTVLGTGFEELADGCPLTTPLCPGALTFTPVVRSVQFGGVSVAAGATTPSGAPALSVLSPTMLVVTSPAATSAGPVDVTVTTGGGTSPLTSADQFSYFLGVPGVQSMSPSSGLATAYTVVVVTGQAFALDGVSAVLLGGRPVLFKVVDDGHLLVLVPPEPAPAPGPALLTVEGGGGALPNLHGVAFTYLSPSAAT